MASHILFATTTPGDYVFSLAPYPSTQIYKAGYIKVTLSQTGASAGSLLIKPMVSDTAPAAQTLSASLNAVSDVVILDSAKFPAAEIGHPFARGFNPDAQGAPVATHLCVTVSSAVNISIEVD